MQPRQTCDTCDGKGAKRHCPDKDCDAGYKMENFQNSVGLHFAICQKDASGQAWVNVKGNMTSLSDAMHEAQMLVATSFEVGVLVETSSGRLVYWTSQEPNVLNSRVLEVAVTRSQHAVLSYAESRVVIDMLGTKDKCEKYAFEEIIDYLSNRSITHEKSIIESTPIEGCKLWSISLGKFMIAPISKIKEAENLLRS